MLRRIPLSYKTKVLRCAAATADNAAANSTMAILQIMRWDPSMNTQKVESYEWEKKQDFMVLDLLTAIKAHQDPTLSFRASCCEGVCGSCAMNINGINSLACVTYATPHTIVGPLPNFPVIKDLVVDLRHFFSQYEFIRPFVRNVNLQRYHIDNILSRYMKAKRVVYGDDAQEITKTHVGNVVPNKECDIEENLTYDDERHTTIVALYKTLLNKVIDVGDVEKAVLLLDKLATLGFTVPGAEMKEIVLKAMKGQHTGM